MKCQICLNEGLELQWETVRTQVNEAISANGLPVYACMDPECQIAYYSDGISYTADRLKNGLWYKTYDDNKIMCYCHSISQSDIKRIFEVNKDLTENELMMKFDRTNKSDCLHNNPLGRCCHKDIRKFIESLR